MSSEYTIEDGSISMRFSLFCCHRLPSHRLPSTPRKLKTHFNKFETRLFVQVFYFAILVEIRMDFRLAGAIGLEEGWLNLENQHMPLITTILHEKFIPVQLDPSPS